MDNIVRIHEKILDHLVQLRKNDPGLIFVPRKINNQKRLDKGYWFIGNEYYLNLSFWNGMDWKEKIHNIGFVVLEDKKSYIELSAQDSASKSQFLEKIVSKVVGFKRINFKNKWHKHYKGDDYIKNLNDFIKEFKPIVDELIVKEKPKGIQLLDKLFDNEYTKGVILLRKRQSDFGLTNKVSRLCWNTNGWKFPSGSQGKSLSAGSYEANTGFGHEEWLFDKLRIINEYHFAFIQSLFITSEKHSGKVYNISLFTINNLNKRYYVGRIKNAKCISKEESKSIYDKYKVNGWLDLMRKDLEKVGADWKKLLETEPEYFFNIKFKFEDIELPEELIEIALNDFNLTTSHYKLLPQKGEFCFETDKILEEESTGNKKSTGKRRKVFNIECEYDPYHDQMQNALFDLLSNSVEYQKVYIEKGRIDIKAKTIGGKWHYFEIKTDNPKLSIRKALGQILEYAYFPNTDKAEKLFIVADAPPNTETKSYLNHIRNRFGLPISYRFYDLENDKLSEEY